MRSLKETTQKYELGRLVEHSEAAKRRILVEAWKGSGYLFGLKGRDLGNMAVLAENQKRHLLRENNTTADMAVFDTIAIPMIRRQNSLMVTPNLVSVQPLSYSSGMAFYMDYHVSDSKNQLKSGYLGLSPNGNTFGETWPDGSPKSGYDRHYDNNGYDNTKGRVIYRGWNNVAKSYDNTAGGRGGVNDTAAGAGTFKVSAIDMGTGAGVSNINVVEFDLSAVGGITMDQAASLTLYGYVAGATTTSVGNAGVDFFVQTSIQNYTDYIFSTGRGDGSLTDAQTAGGGTVAAGDGTTSTYGRLGGPGAPNQKVRLRIIPATANMGSADFYLSFKEYLNLELNPAYSSELKLQILQIPITTQIHKMKTSWTVELAQDLAAYHALDAEAELTQLLAEEVAAEKDRHIVRELVNLAGHFELWNADFKNAVDPNPANTVFRGTEAGYNQTLIYAIQRINGKIQKSTRRGGANWILISAEGATKLYNLDMYKAIDTNEEGTKFAAGVERIGTIQSKFTVYVDPNLPAEVCLVGRKGSSFFDTGYVYCPYIEYILSPIVLEDQEFNPRRMISSRYGTHMLNNKFYGIVWMKGIEHFNVFMEAVGVVS
jgi:hypothetical protein